MGPAQEKPSAINNEILWQRIIGAVEAVRDRVERACLALEAAEIPYAVARGNAVAMWVESVDDGAIRNARDVDILLRRENLQSATVALERAGFVADRSVGSTRFSDASSNKPRGWLRIFFAGEKVREDCLEEAPDVVPYEVLTRFRVLFLVALVRMELSSWRAENGMHLRDLIGVGLVDASWLARLPPQLAERLAQILANPDG